MQSFSSLLFLLIFCFFNNTLWSQKKEYRPDQSYSVESLLEDFGVLHTAFYQEHPAWGKYHPEDSMSAWFEATAQQIDRPMTETEFRQLLYPLIAKLGCGHTRIKTPRAYRKYDKKRNKAKQINQYLPFQAQKIDSQLIVIQPFTKDSAQLLPGTEITSINGLSAKKIMANIQSMFPSDGYNQSHKERVINLDFTGFYHFYFGDQEQFQFQVRKADGQLASLEIAPFAVPQEGYKAALKKSQVPSTVKDSLILKKKGYQLHLLRENLQTAVIKIKGFSQKPGRRFYRKAFDFISTQNIPNLIIDLRDNGGGSGKDAMNLISYINDRTERLVGKKKRGKLAADKYVTSPFGRKVLAPIFLPISFKTSRDQDYFYMGIEKKVRTKNNFNGHIFLLNNGLSFSSSVIVGAYLLNAGNTTVIGQESGGGQKGTNAFQMPRLRLPHTQIELVYPLYDISNDVAIEDQGRGILPDHPIRYTLEDILEGRDLELEKVLELLAQ